MMSVNRFLTPHARHYSKHFIYKNSLNPTLFWDVNYHISPFNRRGNWGISPEMNFYRNIPTTKDFPGGSDSRVCLQCRRAGFNPWAREIPWRRKWQSTPIFLPGKPHGWSSLADYSPWSSKELDITEWLTHTHIQQMCDCPGWNSHE